MQSRAYRYISYCFMSEDANVGSVYLKTPKEQRKWIIQTVSEFRLEQRMRYFILVRNVVGAGAIVEVGAAGVALDLDKLNDNMILTLIALAMDVEAGTRLS